MFSTPRTVPSRSSNSSSRQLFHSNTTSGSTPRSQRGEEAEGEQPVPNVSEGSSSEIIEALRGLQQQVSALQAQVQQSCQAQGEVNTPRCSGSSTTSTPKRNSKELVVCFTCT